MMSESEILSVLNTLTQFLRVETAVVRAHQMEEALKMIEKKERLNISYMQARDALKRFPHPTDQFIKALTQANQLLKEAAQENKDIWEIVLSAHTRVINAVVDKLNEKNRPTMMYTAGARAMNLNKYMPPAMALNEKL